MTTSDDLTATSPSPSDRPRRGSPAWTRRSGESRLFACPLLPEQIDRGGDETFAEGGDRYAGMQDEAEVEAVAQP